MKTERALINFETPPINSETPSINSETPSINSETPRIRYIKQINKLILESLHTFQDQAYKQIHHLHRQ
jgi:hypothetical protein